MNRYAIAVFLSAALIAPAIAQPAPKPPAPPQMLVLPAGIVQAVMQDMRAMVTLHPELATPAITQAFDYLGACAADNPINGRLTRQGPDQCPDVTAALAKDHPAPSVPAKPVVKAMPAHKAP